MSASLTVDQILSAAESRGLKVNRRTSYMQCPAHRGEDLNCHVFTGTDGGALAHCHSHDCAFPDIKAALGLDTPRKRSERATAPKPSIVATYDYRTATGDLAYQTVRYEPGKDGKDKSFAQRRPDGNGGWVWNLQGVDPLPYRLPELVASTDIVLVVEGEKDVDNLRALGFTATCNHGGAGKWTATHAAYLASRDVAILPDNDDAGLKHASKVVDTLRSVAASIRLVTLPNLPEKGDVSDWLPWGGTADQLRAMIETTTPWAPPKAEDGAALLDDVAAYLRRFVAYPSEAACVAHALWIAHTHLMGAWDSTPRIAFLSPEPGSGKTRALEASELLVPRPVEAVNMSAAALFRKVADEDGLPTILYDECDTVFGSRKAAENNEDVRGLLNAGHRKGAKSYRCVARGREIAVVEYEAFCAVALAGLGDLPDTILSRSVIVRMRRRAPNERVEPFRRRLEEQAGHALRDRLATWGAAIESSIGNPWPELPRGIEDRNADVWEALVAVADAAGGAWPQRAREAAVSLVSAARESTPSLGIRLLADVRDVFRDLDHVSSESLVQKLNAIEDAPWGEIAYGKPLNARGLSQRLRQFGVTSKQIRLGGETRKGYRREDLADAWTRYLPSAEKSETSETPETRTENPSVYAGTDVSDTSARSETLPLENETFLEKRNRNETDLPSNHADVSNVSDVPGFEKPGEGASSPIADRLRTMPTGELTDDERASLNGHHRSDEAAEPDVATMYYERRMLELAGEPGLDRHSA